MSDSGTTIDVWAPHADTVAIDIRADGDLSRRAMRRDDTGWWTTDDPGHGVDYAFSLDDGPPRPDPRSAWQPEGVHGFSRRFDSARFDWQDHDWTGLDARDAVIYELHIGTFTDAGTLDAAVERFDHLLELGVTMIELMPVAAFGGERGWGYDGVALYAVHEAYGGPEALQRFVDAAHRAGLAVCLDVVYNHLGPSGNYLGEFGPYFTDKHDTPWGQAVNLDDDGSQAVRAFIIDNACRWLDDFHIDALRLDAVHALIDDSSTHILAELSDAVAALAERVGRPLSLIAESDLNDASMVESTANGGLGMTAQWADDVHHAIHTLVTGERQGYYVDFGSVEVMQKVLQNVFLHDGGYSTFRERDWGRPVPRDTDPRRFVVFASDHDQVGNRAIGDRPSATLAPGLLAISATLAILSPYTPMIFMGEEWGAKTPWQFFTDHREAELGRAVSEGRKREFGGHGWEELYGHAVEVPDPQAIETFENSRLDWRERDEPIHARLLRWYRDLIQLRKRLLDRVLPRTLDGVTVKIPSDKVLWMAYDGADLLLNVGDQATEVTLAGRQLDQELLAWAPEPAAPEVRDAELVMALAPQDVRVLATRAMG